MTGHAARRTLRDRRGGFRGGALSGWLGRALLGYPGARRRQRLTILIYHRVLPAPDPLRPAEPVAATFAWQMELVASLFNVLPLDEAVKRLQEGTLPARAAAVSFDDGYADNATEALPTLQRVGVPATFFIATGFLNGGRMFNDTVIEVVRRLPAGTHDFSDLGLGPRPLQDTAGRRALIRELLPRFKYATPAQRETALAELTNRCPEPLPDDLMMTDDQVRALDRAGMTLGAHTVRHPILATLDRDRAREELMVSREMLEALIGRPVTLFAYPNGRMGDDYDARDVSLAREAGFRAAVSTHPGTAGPETDPWQLPRFTPWDRTPARFAARLGLNLAGRVG